MCEWFEYVDSMPNKTGIAFDCIRYQREWRFCITAASLSPPLALWIHSFAFTSNYVSTFDLCDKTNGKMCLQTNGTQRNLLPPSKGLIQMVWVLFIYVESSWVIAPELQKLESLECKKQQSLKLKAKQQRIRLYQVLLSIFFIFFDYFEWLCLCATFVVKSFLRTQTTCSHLGGERER